jgi:hypothetical protein
MTSQQFIHPHLILNSRANIMKTKLHSLLLGLTLAVSVAGLTAQKSVVTYQGRVQSGGTAFNGSGQFKFALVTSTNLNHQARATAVVNGGFITGYTVTDGGSGYLSAPVVTISGGGGSGATATANVSGGAVISITANNPGSGYGTPTVTIAPPRPDIDYTTYWSNDGTSSAGSEPASAVNVMVNHGLFTVALGDTTIADMAAISAALFTQSNLQLRIWFNDGVNGFAALDPAQNLTAAPYAAFAYSASNVVGTIPLAQLPPVLALISTNGDNNFFAGEHAGVSTVTGEANVGIGNGALANNMSGSFNTASGSGALFFNTNGSANTAYGFAALYFNKRGSNNTALGNAALYFNDTGRENAAVGAEALYSNTFGRNGTAVGYRALYSNQGAHYNTAIGSLALSSNTDGTVNTAIGAFALASNTSGDANTASGYAALASNMSGGLNTANGRNALYYNTAGDYNSAFGYDALINNTSGSANIGIGRNAGQNITTGNNNIFIGNDGFGNESNAIRIGTTQNKAVIVGIHGATIASGGTPVYVNPSGLLGTITSSGRFKEDIQSMDEASDTLLALKPVTFRYKEELDPEGTPHFGLIAEEVEKVDPNLVVRDAEGKVYSVRYEAVNAMLLNEFLKQHRKVEEQSAEVQELKRNIAELKKTVSRLSENNKPAADEAP